MCTSTNWHFSGAQKACNGEVRAGLSGPGQVKAGIGEVKGLRPMGRTWFRGRLTLRVGSAVVEGSHMSEGGRRGSEQQPHLPHKLPLLSLPRPVTPVLLTVPSGNCGWGQLPLLTQGLHVLPPVSEAWLLEPRPLGEEGGRWHRVEPSRKGPRPPWLRPPLRTTGGPVQLISNTSTPGLQATGGRLRT